MSKRKYRERYEITSMTMFDEYCGDYFIFRGKTLHRGFIESWQYRSLKNIVKNGWLFAAEEISEGKKELG